jgi:hypothetical protein
MSIPARHIRRDLRIETPFTVVSLFAIFGDGSLSS